MVDNGYEGFLDRADYETICGWAYDSGERDRPLDIEIYDGKVMLARIGADGLRRDLLRAGKGNGRHSFALPTPARLRDGKPHLITAKIADSRFDLSGSPRAIKGDQSPLAEPGVILPELGGEPWLVSRIMDLAHRARGQRYLATSLRSHEILIPCRRDNLNENFESILNHRLVKHSAFETPGELVARIE